MGNWIHATTQRFLGASILLLATVAPAFCNTWIVDQANGPGTNFIDIPPAIAAATAGDVIIVRAGSYSGFTLTRGIKILGQVFNTVVFGPAVVSGLPAGEIAALQGLRAWNFQVTGCAGTVLLQYDAGSVNVQNSSDVRIRETTHFAPSGYELSIVDSRVQVAQASFAGRSGADEECLGGSFPASPGEDGMTCSGSSRLHFVLSNSSGGEGGWGHLDIGCSDHGAAGGNGITTSGPTSGLLELILARSQVSGGPGGGGSVPGFSGNSLVVGNNVTAWSSETTYSPYGPWVYAGGTIIYATVPEPTLELIGTPAPGGTITLRLRAEPGTAVRLNLGSTPIVAPQPGILIEGLVLKQRSFDRGLVPASGVLDTVFPFQAAAPSGKLLIFQCKVTDPISGLTQKSNSIEALIP